jgi:hypothetical protein
VDYGQIVKVYGTMAFGERKYSTNGVPSSYKTTMTGAPDEDLISTSYIQRPVGRPSWQRDKPRGSIMPVRFSPADRAKVERAAKAESLSVSE